MTKAIFLDIDGVLLPIDACTEVEVGLVRSAPMPHIDIPVSRVSKEAVDCVANLAQRQDARIVLISSWRYNFSLGFLFEFLRRIGLAPYLHEDWLAGFKFSSHKGHDIGFWLEDHPETTSAILIDDHDIRNYVRCKQIIPANPRVGLTRKDMKAAAEAFSLDALFREQAKAT